MYNLFELLMFEKPPASCRLTTPILNIAGVKLEMLHWISIEEMKKRRIVFKRGVKRDIYNSP